MDTNNISNVNNAFETELFLPEQQMFFVWTLRTSALFSILGSTLIIWLICKRRCQKKRSINNNVHNRLIFGMSLMDIINSLNLVLASALVPTYSRVYGALGNETSCSAQGFFLTVGFAVGFYNAMLCLYYLAIVKYNVKEEALLYYEKYMHGIAIGIPFILGIIGLALDIYHPRVRSPSYCWVGNGCEFIKDNEEEGKCIPRPEGYVQSFEFVIYTLFAICWITIAYSMTSLYLSVRHHDQVTTSRKIEKKRKNISARTAENTTNASTQSYNSQETAKQATLYVTAFLFTYIFSIVAYTIAGHRISFALMFLDVLFYPLQGFWNFITFIRPRYILLRKLYPEKRFLWIMKRIFFDNHNTHDITSCCSDKEDSHTKELFSSDDELNDLQRQALPLPNNHLDEASRGSLKELQLDGGEDAIPGPLPEVRSQDLVTATMANEALPFDKRSSLVPLVAQDMFETHSTAPLVANNGRDIRAKPGNRTCRYLTELSSLFTKTTRGSTPTPDGEDIQRGLQLPSTKENGTRRYESSMEFGIFDGNDIPEHSPWASHISEGIDVDYDYEDTRSE